MSYEARGHAVYDGSDLIGLMVGPADALVAAEALNARERVLAGRGTYEGSPHPESPTRDMTVPQTCEGSHGQPVSSDMCELNVPHYVTTLGVPHGLVRGRAEVPPYPHHHNAACISQGCTIGTADRRGDLPEVPPSEGLLLRSDRTCGRVGMHNCGVTGRWQSHDSDAVLLEPTGWDERGGSRTVASAEVPPRPEHPPEPPPGSYP